MNHYDYLIVGAGLYGAVFAQQAKKAGKTCLVIDKRGHVAGNIYTEEVEGIQVHRYGAHIFHTSSKAVWQYVNRFAEFNRYTNSPVANYHGEIYNLPFNMNTFNRMWGVVTPAEAKVYMERGHFAPGSMLPKVQAAVKFAASKPGRTALITLLEKAKDGIAGKTGTAVSM